MNAPLRVDPDRLTRLVWGAVVAVLLAAVVLAGGVGALGYTLGHRDGYAAGMGLCSWT